MPPHIKTIEQRVIKFIDENKLLENNDSILIGLSGGADSVFVLSFLNKYKKRFKINLAAAHLNHGLRGEEAQRDEIFCSELCKKFEIPFFVKTVDIKKEAKKKKLSTEEAGREERYKFFAEIAKQENLTKICTAHNSDDNSETVLLNLLKGKGRLGLSGISPKRGNIIRPILILSKEEIEFYLNTLKIKFVIDSSNNENHYQRNILRNQIFPILKEKINPNLNEAIFRSSKILREISKIIDEKILNEERIKFKKNKLSIDLSGNYNLILIEHLIKEARKYFDLKFGFQDVAKIEKLFNSQKGTRVTFRNKIVAVRNEKNILIYKQNESEEKEIPLKIGEGVKFKFGKIVLDQKKTKLAIEEIDFNSIRGNLVLRNWKAGDKFKPLNFTGTKKISDFLTDLKIDTSKKEEIFVISDSEKIIYVVGYRISDEVKVTKNTKQKVYIKWQKN